MSTAKEILVPFMLGGVIISSVKFIATHLDNPALAAIVGGIPTGLISIYFLSADKTLDYAHNYFYVTLILATSILTFYLLQTYTKLSKNVILLVAIATWMTLVGTRYVLVNKYQKKIE
jgi:hypothetical protein